MERDLAFLEFYKTHKSWIKNICYRFSRQIRCDQKDLEQDVCLKLLEIFGRRDNVYATQFIKRSIKNMLIDKYRTEKFESPQDVDFFSEVTYDEDVFDALVIKFTNDELSRLLSTWARVILTEMVSPSPKTFEIAKRRLANRMQGQGVFSFSITQSDIAVSLNLSPAFVSRYFTEIKQKSTEVFS